MIKIMMCSTAIRLKQCRLHAGLTLDDIGKLCNVNKSTVLRWENGDTDRISLTTIQKLADLYHVDPSWLLGADVPMYRKPYTSKEKKAMNHIDLHINLDELIKKVKEEKVEISITMSNEQNEITISPWKPFEYTCPYQNGGTQK